MVMFNFPSNLRVAGTGAIPIILGSTPTAAAPRIFAIGFIPSSSAFSAAIITRADAPSFLPDALPAVTYPSGKIGFSFASFSMLVLRLGYSSVSNTIGSAFL